MVFFKQQVFFAWLLSLLCIGLLVLSIPRFVASLYALYPESVLSQHQYNLPAEIYLNSIKALDDALVWDDNPEYWQAKSLCYLALLNSPSTSNIEKRLLLIQARQSIMSGLAGSPIDEFAWFRLAVINNTLGFQVNDALRLSLYSAPVEPELIMQRLQLAYSYEADLSAEERALWLKQVKIAWKLKPKELVSFVIENPTAKAWFETGFYNDAEQLDQFRQTYDKATQKIIAAPSR